MSVSFSGLNSGLFTLQPQPIRVPVQFQRPFSPGPNGISPSYLPFATLPSPDVKLFQGGYIGGQTMSGNAPPTPQSIMMTVMGELTSGLKNVGKGDAIARSYLSSSGAYSLNPIGEQVKVKKSDEDGYFQALGYEE